MRFLFLDGVRAIAALVVLLHHAYYTQFEWSGTILLFWGSDAVTTFIVLSGFCLGLQRHSQQDFWHYIGRRSRRLLPPYFAAVGVLCCLVVLRAKLQGVDLQVPLSELLPVLAMMRDLFPDRSDWLAGSAVFWSVGLEYRLYWLLPVMAWFYKRKGLAGLGLSAVAFYLSAVAILTLLHLTTNHTWYIFSFAFGFAASQSLSSCFKVRYPLYCLGCALVVVKSQADLIDVFNLAMTDMLVSAIVALLLYWMARSVMQGETNQAITLLSCPVLGWLASWSYSLYLLHYALLIHSGFWLGRQGVTDWGAIAFELVAALLGCWLFSLVFERPFASSSRIEKQDNKSPA